MYIFFNYFSGYFDEHLTTKSIILSVSVFPATLSDCCCFNERRICRGLST